MQGSLSVNFIIHAAWQRALNNILTTVYNGSSLSKQLFPIIRYFYFDIFKDFSSVKNMKKYYETFLIKITGNLLRMVEEENDIKLLYHWECASLKRCLILK